MRRPSPSPRFSVSPRYLKAEVTTWCEETKNASSSAKDLQEELGGLEEFQSLGGNAEILCARLLQAFRNEHGEEPGEADVEQARKVADAILKKRPRPRSMISQKGDGQTPVVAPRRGKAKVAEVSNALAPAVSPLEKGSDSTKLQAPLGSNSELDLRTDGSKASGTEAALQRGNELNLGSSQLPLPAAAAGGHGASGDVPVQTSEVAKDNAEPAVDRAGGR